MTTLNSTAVGEITSTFNSLTGTGVTVAEYIHRYNGAAATEWHGDACGCLDDRCIGYHHDAGARCGCLDVQLDEFHDELCDAYNAREQKP